MPPDNLTPFPRALTAQEQDLLQWMLEHGQPEASNYLPQIPRLTAVGGCGCGCPTIKLALDGKEMPLETPGTLLVQAMATSPEGVVIGILVFVRGGQLDDFELFAYGDETHFSLPAISTLKLPPYDAA